MERTATARAPREVRPPIAVARSPQAGQPHCRDKLAGFVNGSSPADSYQRPTPPAFPQAELCRAFGLAAVAAELNLQIEMLEPEVAEAVGMGAAALFLAGYGPKGIHSRSRRPFEWDDTRNRVRRDVLRSRRLARRAAETGATIFSGDNFNSAR